MRSTICDYTRLDSGIDDGTPLDNLVQSAQAGSHYAFEALQTMYSRRLFKQIVAITRHHEDAEDALQETLCKAFVAMPHFQRRCHIYTWLSRIAINCALMKVRKRRHLQEFSLNHQAGHDQEPINEFPDRGWSPEEIYRAEEWLRHVATASRTLDPKSRRVLMMRVNDDYSLEEIAEALDMSVSAAKARLYRARYSLRLYLPDQRDHPSHLQRSRLISA
jgi:RNA polymerase sigma-70 factor (ECF subfamily)